MKKSVIIGIVSLGVFIAGCGKKEVEPAPANSTNSNAVVVAIGDAKLMSADLEADVAKIIEANKARIPAEQLDAAKQYLTQQFKQQFITQTLVRNEAAKKGISVTDADVTAHANEIIKSAQGRPGAPTTLDELLAVHPLGTARARADLTTDTLVKKFVDQEFVSKVVIDQKEIESQYNQILSNMTRQARSPRPEQVHASHILIKADETKTSDAAKREIDALYEQLKALKGEELAKKFGELAKEKSDCPSGKRENGDLGTFGHGQMVPEFDKAAFEQDVGKLYAPVKTSFGWHLILVKEKIPAKTPTDEEVKKTVAEQMPKKEDLERMMKSRQAQQKFQAYVQRLLEDNGFAQPAAARPAPPPKPAKAIESKPVKVKPSPAKPAKVIESKPVEVKPSPAKPAKAIESKPAEVKPSPVKPT